MPFLLSLLLSVLLSGCALFGGRKAIDLSLHLSQGERFRFVVSNDQFIQQSVMGMDQSIDQTIGTTYAFEVTQATEQGYLMQVTYDRVIFTQQMAMGDVFYDSDSTQKIPTPARGFAAVVGKQFGMEVSRHGEVLKVTGMEALLDQMLVDMNQQGQVPPDMRETLQQQFGVDGVKQTMSNLISFYPTDPVKVGETWEQDVEQSSTTALLIETVYALEKASGSVLTIGSKGEVSPAPNAKPTKMADMTMSYQLDGKQVGEYLLDRDQGLVNQATLTQKVKGNIQMSGGPAGDMTWPITIETTTTIERQ
jgi:hypothetical protein